MTFPPERPLLARLHRVSKTYGGVRALSGVSLEVSAGEMVALVGPSGSGKSTLLRTLNLLTPIDRGEGRVEVLGRPLQPGPRHGPRVRSVRARVGFVFQQFNLVPRLSVFTNVALGALGRMGFWRGLIGLWPASVRRDVLAAMSRVGLGDRARQRASTLSGGQQQRAAVARAVVQKAVIVLADEPVASLDPVAADGVMALLRELAVNDNLAVVVSLHQIDHARRFCDRVVALREGKVVYDGPSSSLDDISLAAIYGGDPRAAALGER